MQVYFDVDMCINCRSCEIACTVNRKDRRMRIEEFLDKVPLVIFCKHCEESPCVDACPTNALERKDGSVVLNKMLCIGCRSCIVACPFGNMYFTHRRISTKCDMCWGYEIPFCVIACPTGALKCDARDVEEEMRERKRKGELIGYRMYAWRP